MAQNSNTPGNKDSEQTILNHSFDKDFNVLAVEGLVYNPITGTLDRKSEVQGNGSLVLTYDGSGNLETITKTIGTVSYVKTLTYDSSNNLTGVSVWSEV